MIRDGHLQRLDVLRAVGALLVLYSHFFDAFASSRSIGAWPIAASILPEGKIGVALFCVVSGFIFEYIVRGRSIHYGRFLGARMWRIYPLYLIILVVALTVFDASPFGLVTQALAFLPAYDPGDVWRQTWTLVIEFQFYLVFPFLTILLARNGIKQLLLLAAFFLTFRLLLWGIGKDVNVVAYKTMLGRAPQFLAGMIAAKLFTEKRTAIAEHPVFLGLSLVLLACSVHYYHLEFGAAHPYFDAPYTSFYSVLWPDVQAVLFAAITLSFLQVRLPRGLGKPGMFSFIGRVSFSLYLTHRMIEYLIARTTDYHVPLLFTGNLRLDAFISCTLLELPLAVALATLTYYAVEQPFQTFKKAYLKPDATEHEPRRMSKALAKQELGQGPNQQRI